MITALRTRYREQLRSDILDAGRKLFLDAGYSGFSMRKLAEILNCSPGAIYLYFKNRDEIFEAIVEASFRELSALQHRLPGDTFDPVELLKSGARLFVEFGLSNKEAYKIAFVLERPPGSQVKAPHGAFAALRALVSRCIASNRFRPIDAETASQVLWTAMHGVISLLIMRPDFPWIDRETLISGAIDNAVGGLLAYPLLSGDAN